jgi:Delta7-sterol 5-desaturase
MLKGGYYRVFGLLNYFIFATLSYFFIFDMQAARAHPKFLKNQISLEIKQALYAMPGMAIPTTALFVLEVRGYTKIYDMSSQGPGRWYDILQPAFFLLFTDFLIYWIHRGLHLPGVYKHLHKPHHKWIVPTPFAAYAFHPLDGFAQSVPYHLFPFIFPMHKFLFLGGFFFVNIWSILIHDGEYIANNPVINGSACHTAHHLFFK